MKTSYYYFVNKKKFTSNFIFFEFSKNHPIKVWGEFIIIETMRISIKTFLNYSEKNSLILFSIFKAFVLSTLLVLKFCFDHSTVSFSIHPVWKNVLYLFYLQIISINFSGIFCIFYFNLQFVLLDLIFYLHQNRSTDKHTKMKPHH